MLGIDWLSQSETASEAACCTYTLCIRGSAPVTSIQLLNPSADHVYMREGKELDENVQESNWFDYLLSSDGKTITRSGLTTITTRS